jgi:hypothetical protein
MIDTWLAAAAFPLRPARQWTREEVLAHLSPVPAAAGMWLSVCQLELDGPFKFIVGGSRKVLIGKACWTQWHRL